PPSHEELVAALRAVVAVPTTDRLFHVADAMRAGIGRAELHELTKIDPWFLSQVERIVRAEEAIAKGELGPAELRDYKRLGFSDAQIAKLAGKTEEDVRSLRKAAGITPVYARVDTCASEFVAR